MTRNDTVISCISIYVSGGRYDSFLSFGLINVVLGLKFTYLKPSCRMVLWYHMSMYMYLEVGTTYFYHFALYNFVLGLTTILLKSELFRWWMSYGAMAVYGHVTMLGL